MKNQMGLYRRSRHSVETSKKICVRSVWCFHNVTAAKVKTARLNIPIKSS
jgi:hypothetical protein